MEISLQEIYELIDKVKQAGLSSFEYRDGDTKIKIQGSEPGKAAGTGKGAGAGGTAVGAGRWPEADGNATGAGRWPGDDANGSGFGTGISGNNGGFGTDVPVPQGKLLESPMVGTFYTAPSEDGAPFVKVGDAVKAGQTLGIIEAMKLMNEVKAEWDGTVEEILVENDQMVEYGQPLFRIKEA